MTAVAELVETPTLEDLAETANREHGLALSLANEVIEHAIRAGEALLAARNIVANREWSTWLETNFVARGVGTARVYMRLAQFQDVVRENNVLHIEDAKLLLADKGLRREKRHWYPNELRASAQQRRAVGESAAVIARDLGVDPATVRNWTVSADELSRRRERDAERAREKRRALKALESQEQQRAVRKALVKEGQAFNEVYAMLTRMDDLLGQARTETEDREKRRAISEMHAMRNKMRDTAHAMLGIS